MDVSPLVNVVSEGEFDLTSAPQPCQLGDTQDAASARPPGYLLGHVQELVQVHSSVGELPEGTLLLDLDVRLRITQPALAR